ncbi:MAG TPA: hypothetical protein PLH72_18190 [Vicinamibacterales bacterium]|nr:hypothetical protein [Vicinamibacterales bacterium]
MATTTHDKTDGVRNVVTERVLDAARQAEQVAHEARRVTERAAEVLEDGLHTAKRTFKRRRHELEDLRDQAEIRVRKNPLSALGVTFAAGLVMGVLIGWAGQGSRR